MRRILSSNQNVTNVKFEEKRSPNPCFASGNEWKSGDAEKTWTKRGRIWPPRSKKDLPCKCCTLTDCMVYHVLVLKMGWRPIGVEVPMLWLNTSTLEMLLQC